MRTTIDLVKAENYESDEYHALCDELGFYQSVHFVDVKSGKIGFTCGKPEEVRSLLDAVKLNGYKPTAGLERAACR